MKKLTERVNSTAGISIMLIVTILNFMALLSEQFNLHLILTTLLVIVLTSTFTITPLLPFSWRTLSPKKRSVIWKKIGEWTVHFATLMIATLFLAAVDNGIHWLAASTLLLIAIIIELFLWKITKYDCSIDKPLYIALP